MHKVSGSNGELIPEKTAVPPGADRLTGRGDLISVTQTLPTGGQFYAIFRQIATRGSEGVALSLARKLPPKLTFFCHIALIQRKKEWYNVCGRVYITPTAGLRQREVT